MPRGQETNFQGIGGFLRVEAQGAPAEGFGQFRVYLDPKEPTFLGSPNIISLYEALKR